MIKRGFTLQEILITLGIIGVVAALCAPALQNIIPDKRKALYIKAYNNLVQITDDLLGNPQLYWTIYNETTGDVSARGLKNLEKPLVDDTDLTKMDTESGSIEISGDNKYPLLVAQRMNISGKPYTTGNGIGGFSDIANAYGFMTTDGFEWAFAPTQDISGSDDVEQFVYVNVNPEDKDNDCSYSSDCKKPARFVFKVHADGRIEPQDIMGLVYLQNMTNTQSTSDDEALAEKVLDKTSSTDSYAKKLKVLQELQAET